MTDRPNRQVTLAARPTGVPGPEHFAISSVAVEPPGPGQVVVRNEFLSVDPAMRGWVNAAANYADPVPLGAVMRSFGVGVIEESRSAAYGVGDRVVGLFGWQERATVDAQAIERRFDHDDLSPSLALGVLGLTGVTAWLALTEIGQPRVGDTVVVSTAAGSVGSVAGQLASLAGCRTVAITGGPRKVGICLDEFGYDVALDYRSATFEADLAAACPAGVDVFFDNTSGRIADAVLPLLARRARVIVCGTAAIDSWDPWPHGPLMSRHLLVKSARAEGFLYFDHAHRAAEAVARLAPLVRAGQIRYREEVLEGLESAPGSIAGLYRGENLGKRVISLTGGTG
jgi:NADPH-dependent curcumin reductase CurA